MKRLMPVHLLAVALLAACTNQDHAPTDSTASTAGRPMDPAGNAEAAAGVTATTTGTVQSVDAANGRIVIAHGPVDALQWPAMTMGFKASPEQLRSVQPGQRVDFAFVLTGPSATLTRIATVK